MRGAEMGTRGTIYADDDESYPYIHDATTQRQLVSLLDGARFGSSMVFGPAAPAVSVMSS